MFARRWVRWSLLVAVVTVWTLHWLWPLPRLFSSHLIRAPYWWDAQLAIDLLDQGRHNLLHQPWHLLDARILHPALDVLAYSENFLTWAPLNAVLVPLLGPTGAFNLCLFLTLVLTVLATFAWLRPRVASPVAALAGAVFFGYAPWRLGLLGRLQLESTMVLPLILLALEHALTTPHWRRWVLVAGLFAAQMGLCIYYGVYLLALVAPVVAWRILRDPRHRTLHGLRQVAVGGALVGLPVAWLLHPYATVTRDMGFARDDHAIYASSGLLRDLFTSSDLMAHWRSLAIPTERINASSREPVAFAGVIGPLLAVLGLALVVAHWRKSRGAGPTRPLEHAPFRFGPATLLLWIALCGIGFFAIGPNAPLHGRIYGTLLKAAPMLAGLRFSNRWMVPLTLFGAAFVAWGVDVLQQAMPKPWLRQALAGLAVAALACELDTTALPLVPAPQPEAVYTRIAQDKGAGALLELPMDGEWHSHRIARNDGVRVHGLPIVGGFTGYNPPLHGYLREILEPTGNYAHVHAALATLGVNRVVVHLHQSDDPAQLLRGLDAQPWLRQLSNDGHDAVYALPDVAADRAQQVRQTWSTAPLLRQMPANVVPIAQMTIQEKYLSRAGSDGGDPCITPEPPDLGDSIQIDFAVPVCATGLIFDSRANPLGYVSRLMVSTIRPDGSDDLVLSVPDRVPLQLLATAPARALDEVPLPPTRGRTLWLRGEPQGSLQHVRVRQGTGCRP